MKTLSELLKDTNLIILDTAMGTELQEREADLSLPLWSARPLIDNPDLIRQIHIENIDAGADIITTDTFRTQKRVFEKAGYHFEEMSFTDTAKALTERAVEIAQEAVMLSKENILIAGCIAPLEDCYDVNLIPESDVLCAEHFEHITNLIEASVDILLAETMNNIREISAVLNQIHKFEKEFIISLLCKNENELYSGEKLSDAIKVIEKFSPNIISINCIHPSIAEKIILTLKQLTGTPLGVYANIGDPSKFDSGVFQKNVTEDEYYKYSKRWIELGVQMIGGCCGTSPSYINKLKVLKNKKDKSRK